MHSPGINGEGELRGQPANPGSPGKMAVKTECVYMYSLLLLSHYESQHFYHAVQDCWYTSYNDHH